MKETIIGKNFKVIFSDEEGVISVLRWICKGLNMKETIRKIQIDKEVSKKAKN